MVHAILYYVLQPMRIRNVFSNLVTYLYITRSVMNGRTYIMIKVNMVGGLTRHMSDIYMDKYNNSHQKLSHTRLLTFINNIYRSHITMST